MDKPVASFQHNVSNSVKLKGSRSYWLALANIPLVPDSVEEEQHFDKLAFIKNERRNRLLSDHLNACLVLATQCMWEFRDFPFLRAAQKWFKAKKRLTAAHARQRQRDPGLMEISDESKDVRRTYRGMGQKAKVQKMQVQVCRICLLPQTPWVKKPL